MFHPQCEVGNTDLSMRVARSVSLAIPEPGNRWVSNVRLSQMDHSVHEERH